MKQCCLEALQDLGFVVKERGEAWEKLEKAIWSLQDIANCRANNDDSWLAEHRAEIARIALAEIAGKEGGEG